MATTAAIVCTPSTLSASGGAVLTSSMQPPGGGMRIVCALTLTNGGATDVQVTAVQPYAGKTDSIAFGAPPIGPGQVVNVVASNGTLVLRYDAIAYAPSWASSGFPQNLSSAVYTVGAHITMSDASSLDATTATITINAPTAP